MFLIYLSTQKLINGGEPQDELLHVTLIHIIEILTDMS